MANSGVVIDNVRETRRALAKFAPEVKKELDKANRETASPLAALAKTFFKDKPMRNWGKWTDARGRDLSYTAAEARRGIKIKAGKRSKKSPYSAVTQLQNNSVAGAIYEMAGRKTNNTQFTRNMQAVKTVAINKLSRVIWSAVKEYPISKYTKQVLENYADAEKRLQKILDSMESSV